MKVDIDIRKKQMRWCSSKVVYTYEVLEHKYMMFAFIDICEQLNWLVYNDRCLHIIS